MFIRLTDADAEVSQDWRNNCADGRYTVVESTLTNYIDRARHVSIDGCQPVLFGSTCQRLVKQGCALIEVYGE